MEVIVDKGNGLELRSIEEIRRELIGIRKDWKAIERYGMAMMGNEGRRLDMRGFEGLVKRNRKVFIEELGWVVIGSLRSG